MSIDATQYSTKLFNRNFTMIWIAQSLSFIGDFIYNTALVLWIGSALLAHASWAPLAISGIFLAMSIPVALVGPIAGVFADRWNKKRTMLSMDAVRAILVLLLLPATGIMPLPFFAGGHLPANVTLGAIYVIVLLAETCGQFFIPSRTVLIKDVVAEEHLSQAIGLSQSVWALAIVIGPPIATVLFFSFGVQWTLIINAASFVISFLAVLMVSPPKISIAKSTIQPHFWQEFKGGIQFTARDSFISTVIGGGAIIMLGAASLNALGFFYLIEDLHSSPTLYGLMDAALGIGVIAGSLILGGLGNRLGLMRILNASLLAIGVGTIIISRVTSYPIAILLFGISGFAQGGLNVALTPLMMKRTPREVLGRVIMLVNSTITVATLLGTLLAGYLTGTVLVNMRIAIAGTVFTRIDTLYFFAGILCLTGATYIVMRLGWHDPTPVQQETQQGDIATAMAE